MTDPGITLNIYNKPPELEDNNSDNINQNETGLNQTSDSSPQDTAENIRPDETSAPRPNYNFQMEDNTRNDLPVNYQNNLQPIPIRQYPYPMLGYPQNPPMGAVPVTPVPAPMIQPYNPQIVQPVIVQQRPVNQQTEKIIITKKKSDDGNAECCGFLAGCGAVLAACCLLSLCAGGGGHGGRRGRW